MSPEPRLCHFTPFDNIAGILQHGLLSREALERCGVNFKPSDFERLDNKLDVVSLSIQTINFAMFGAKRDRLRSEWIVFEVDPSVLWTHRCRFCWENAASRQIVRHTGRMDGPWAFQKMFEDKPCGWSVDETIRQRNHCTTVIRPTLGRKLKFLKRSTPSSWLKPGFDQNW